MPTAKGMPASRRQVRPKEGMFTGISAKPRRWQMEAPYCFPRPMASIFIMPLSKVPWKSVWGLIRPTGTT